MAEELGSGVMGNEAKGALGIGSNPKANLNALPGAYQKQKNVYQSKIEQTLKQRADETKPLQSQLEGLEKKRDIFEDSPPVHTDISPAPKFEPKQLSDGFSLMLGLASFAGMASRQPLTAALNNMSGMMKGLQEGNKENFDRSYKEWESNFKVAEAKYKDELSAYQKILGDMNKSIDQKMREIRDVGLKYDNKLVIAQAQSDNPDHIIKLTESLGKLSHQMATESQGWARIRLSQERQETAKAKASEGSVALTPEGMKLAAEYTAAGIPLPGGFSRQGMSRGNAILNELASHEEGGAGSGSQTAVRFASLADKSTLAALTKKQSNIHATLNSFHNNIATWDSIAEGRAPELGGEKIRELGNKMKKLDFGDVTTLNDWQLKLKTLDSDPAAVAYVTAAFTVAMDYSRIMASQGQSAAQVTEGARNEALNLVRAGYNKNARQALIGTLESDTEGQLKGVDDEVGKIYKRLTKGGSSGPTSSTPNAKVDSPNKNSKGWILHTDAKGNKAYVGPNNEVEEVK